MVKDSARKKAARAAHAHATGKPYTAAARHTTRRRAAGISALGVHTDLMQALGRAGWPVEYEIIAENVECRGYAGPTGLTVGRADQISSFDGGHPDPDDLALTGAHHAAEDLLQASIHRHRDSRSTALICRNPCGHGERMGWAIQSRCECRNCAALLGS